MAQPGFALHGAMYPIEDYGQLRCLSYPNTDVFLLCFSMVDPKTLDVCQTVWLPEIRKYAGDNVPVILVGTKEDLLDSAKEQEKVSLEAARKAASQPKVNLIFVAFADNKLLINLSIRYTEPIARRSVCGRLSMSKQTDQLQPAKVPLGGPEKETGYRKGSRYNWYNE
ncbi:Ras family protein [Ancylostoma duodenale]|uniref:Ras family protein n=1 Tax=Ancylostoma duodenale TaxID=51022 RepID=A0A0C2GZS0_9BILA|nr:Ras family protein [Ancylostoma duodenale]